MKKIPKIIKLNNGATILYAKTKKKASAISLGFLGGNMEDEKEGTAHFLEHMLLKQTKNRTFDEINKDKFEICRVGAFTSTLLTAVETLRTNRLINKSFDLLADILLNTKLDEKYIESEKGVIHEELNRRLDQFQTNIMPFHASQMYEDRFDYPKGLGSHENIESMSLEDLHKFRKKNYVSQNFLMSIVTKLPLRKVKKLYRQHIEPNLVVAENYQERRKYSFEPIKPETLRIVNNEKLQQVECIITIVTNLKRDDYKNRTVSSYVRTLIGETTSPIFLKLREKGLTYIFSAAQVYVCENHTSMELHFKTSPEKVKSVIDIMSECFKEIYENGMDEDTFTQRTLNLKYLEDEEETVERIMNRLNNMVDTYNLLGKFRKPYNWEKENKKLTNEYVNEYFKMLLSKNNKMYVTYLGNLKEEDVYNLEETKSKLLF